MGAKWVYTWRAFLKPVRGVMKCEMGADFGCRMPSENELERVMTDGSPLVSLRRDEETDRFMQMGKFVRADRVTASHLVRLVCHPPCPGP